MYQDLAVFQYAGAMAAHAGKRQAVVAANIAHADTPGYQAKVLDDFRSHVSTDQGLALSATRPAHFNAADGFMAAKPVISAGEPALNGNTVSLEDELLRAVDVSREHNRALTIYRHALTVLNAAIGRR